MANYLIYPSKVQNITQNYSNSYTHKPHTTGNIKDYPIDEACADGGRSYMYCPCDEMKIVKIYGVGNGGTNTIWLQSTSKVNFADGTSNYVTIMVTHPNDDTLRNLKVGQTFKRKAAMFLEGTDGNATGNHFHIAVGKGKMTDGGWLQNDKGSWVLRTTNGTCKPESAFYIDEAFTTVKNSQGIKFKKMPTTTQTSTTTTTTTTTTTKIGGNDMTRGYFAKGDANEGVYALKQLLMALKYKGVISQGVDDNNIFGEGTKTAVKQVQAKAGIEVDGYAGPETLHACYKLLK